MAYKSWSRLKTSDVPYLLLMRENVNKIFVVCSPIDKRSTKAWITRASYIYSNLKNGQGMLFQVFGQ
jgi:hypothetical protein